MNMMSLIFGSWFTFDLDFACGLILIILAISAFSCMLYLKNKDVDRLVFVILGSMAVCFIFCSIPYFKSFRPSPEIEKMRYENHEYLIFKGHTLYHNPDCPCRKLMLSDKKEK